MSIDKDSNWSELQHQYAKQLKTKVKQLRRTLQKQQQEAQQAADWLLFSQLADSLLSMQDTARKPGARETLLNIHTGQPIEVKLNVKCTLAENADLFYKKARKGKRGEKIANEKVQLTTRKIEEIENLRHTLSEVESEEQLYDLHKQLDLYLNFQKTDTHSREPKQQCPYKHIQLEEFDIFIGKNDRQNDELTTRFAKPWDYWFHVAQYAGSHIVLRWKKNEPSPPPQHILKTAAGLAVWYSKARHTSYAEVHYCQRRYVHKPRKSKPGQVVLNQYATIRAQAIDPQQLFR